MREQFEADGDELGSNCFTSYVNLEAKYFICFAIERERFYCQWSVADKKWCLIENKSSGGFLASQLLSMAVNSRLLICVMFLYAL